MLMLIAAIGSKCTFASLSVTRDQAEGGDKETSSHRDPGKSTSS